jgi:hypothetical protein
MHPSASLQSMQASPVLPQNAGSVEGYVMHAPFEQQP